MTADAGQILEDGLRALGFSRAADIRNRLIAYGELLLAENQKTNLVGAKAMGDLIGPHFLDSLAPLAGKTLGSPAIDLGSGAGLPGIPAAFAFPDVRFVLLEPRTKRAGFLRMAVDRLGIANVEVRRQSAAALAAEIPDFDAGTVLIRALAEPTRSLELALPLLRVGGRAVLYLGRRVAPDPGELRDFSHLGAEIEEARPIEVPYLGAQRHAWWFKKGRPKPQVRAR